MKKTLLSITLFCFALISSAQSWVSQATGFTNPARDIQGIQIVDANTVWALAGDGSGVGTNVQEFTRTLDGGATWIPGTINLGDNTLKIGNLCAISATTAWVSAFDNTNGLGGVWKTTDGGQTWVAQNTTAFTTAGSSWCDGVHFFDENNGLAYGDPVGSNFEIYTTSDGGATWTAVPAGTTTNPNAVTNEWGYAGSFAYAGNSFWFTTSKGKIYRTTDMGLHWTKLNSPLSDFGGGVTTTNFGTLYFSDNNTGMILGTKDTASTFKIYTTTNGGTNWATGVVYSGFLNLCYIPNTTTLISTSDSTTLGTGSAYSMDNGATWTPIDADIAHGVPAFLNPTTGWCGGINQSATTDGIFKFNGNLANQMFETTDGFKVYPNPAHQFVTISSKEVDSFQLTVTDITGKVLLNNSFTGVENSIDTSNFMDGIYFFTMRSDSKTQTIKIVKN
jgi:photosystem II stability/assembly factor-like uncharacterized protein